EAVEVVDAGLEVERKTAVLPAARDVRADMLGLDVDPTNRVDEGREAGQVNHDDVVDLDAREPLNRLDRERGASYRKARVDLAHAVAWNLRDGVSWDREPPRDPAAHAPEHHRVRVAAGHVVVRSRLLGPGPGPWPLVGAENENRVGGGEHVAARRERLGRGGGKADALGPGADHEQHE